MKKSLLFFAIMLVGSAGECCAMQTRSMRSKRGRNEAGLGGEDLSLYKEFAFPSEISLNSFTHATALITVPSGMRADLFVKTLAGKRPIEIVSSRGLNKFMPWDKKLFVFDTTLGGSYGEEDEEEYYPSDSDYDSDDEEIVSTKRRMKNQKNDEVDYLLGAILGSQASDVDLSPRVIEDLIQKINELEKPIDRKKKTLLQFVVLARKDSVLATKFSSCFSQRYDVPHMDNKQASRLLSHYQSVSGVFSAKGQARKRKKSNKNGATIQEYVKGIETYGFEGVKMLSRKLAKNQMSFQVALAQIKSHFAAAISREQFLSGSNVKKIGETRKPSISFKDIAIEVVPEKLRNIVELAKRMKTLSSKASYEIPPVTTILLHGPTGTGKTFISEAMASEFGADIFKYIPASSLGSKWMSQTQENVRRLLNETFEELMPGQEALIFLDEIDALAAKRSKYGDSGSKDANATVNELLTGIDKINKGEQGKTVRIVVATNLIENLDPAFLRRFAYKFKMDVPKREARLAVLENRWKNYVRNQEAPKFLEKLASDTQGYNCGDLDTIIKNACMNAAIDGSDKLLEKHVKAAFNVMNKKREMPEWAKHMYV